MVLQINENFVRVYHIFYIKKDNLSFILLLQKLIYKHIPNYHGDIVVKASTMQLVDMYYSSIAVESTHT